MNIIEQADVFDKATDTFIQVFNGYQSYFLQWGETIFFTLLLFNFGFLFLRYAFNGNSLDSVMYDFLMEFFTVGFFFTLMLNIPLLTSFIHTAEWMGKTLTHHPLSPSAIIANGLAIGGKILGAAGKSSFLTLGLGSLIALITYGVMLYVFFSIAIDLAVTLIVSWWLATMSAFFLAFAGHKVTRTIAKHSLDALLGNCVKLLALYLVVGIGITTIDTIYQSVPDTLVSVDTYGWLMATALLLLALYRTFTYQAVHIVSHAVAASKGIEAGAAVLSATQTLNQAKQSAQSVISAVARSSGAATLAGMANNAAAHFKASDTFASGIKHATTNTLKDTAASAGGVISDHFKQLAEVKQSKRSEKIASVASRLHAKAKQQRDKPN